MDAAQQQFEKAIAELEKVAKANQQALDPGTSATIDKNLGIIDQAIADNRAAVKSEPASVAARETLFEALRSKVTLLQDTISLINEMRKGNNAAAAQLVNKSDEKASDIHSSSPSVRLCRRCPAPARRAGLSRTDAIVREGARRRRRAGVPAAVARRQPRRADRADDQEVIKLGADGMLALGNIAGDIVGDPRRRIRRDRRDRQDRARPRRRTTRASSCSSSRSRSPSAAAGPTCGRAIRAATIERRNNRRNINVSVAYTVTAPAGTRMSIDSISGSVKVTDIKGDISANTISGDVRISGAGRISAAKTISGMVEIADAQTRRRARVLERQRRRHPPPRHRAAHRRRRRSAATSGSRSCSASASSANTTSGSVAFTGPLARNGRYELKSFSGEVRLLLAGNTGFEDRRELLLRQTAARLRRSRRAAARATAAAAQRTLNGTYGDGSAVLDLTTFSGSIVISKR